MRIPCKGCPVLAICISKNFVMCELVDEYVSTHGDVWNANDERIREVGKIIKKDVTFTSFDKISFANWNRDRDEEAMEEEQQWQDQEIKVKRLD